MLHFETVEPGTLAILRRLMEIPALREFNLVGGTALSLRYGHRKSIDLDLFIEHELDYNLVVSTLKNEFGKAFNYRESKAQWAVFCFIDNVKVDMVKYKHDRLEDLVVEDGLRLYADEDLAAMKVAAILGRGKKKDFWDLHELLERYGANWVIENYERKFPTQQFAISIPIAMTYFVDAEESEEPVSLKGQSWEKIKDGICEHMNRYVG